ncbi:helix-turn-helix transcriptional regulator [Sphaerisporangium sp. NPDC088356]|uniref:helix-turn-helix domain-containing protein n=1 Tax=Sphaerisporangium sp. NPDC088356 TaxID=3154871 RepID=UPI00342B92A5
MTQIREVEQFAALLQMLKDRSGASFEMLARRTNTSRSSLHRYCSGSKIPADYDTVRAFAGACGATGEQLRELHRLWVLADASRGRIPESGPDIETQEDTGPGESTVGGVSKTRSYVRWIVVAAVAAAGVAVAALWATVRGPESPESPASGEARRGAATTVAIRVFNIEGDCQTRKDRFPACSLGLARDPRRRYDATNVVAHRVWHDDVLYGDCVLFDGDRVEDERGVGATRWFRVRLDDVPGGHAWLPAVRSAENPALPICS